MNEYRFTLPYPPSLNTYWRRRGSQYYISDKGQKYRKDVQQIIRQLKLDIFTKSRLRIKVIADVPDSRRRDLDNILKGLLDSLIHAGFAEDDEQFDDIRVIRGVKVPGGRLGIKITELESNEHHNSNDTRTAYTDTRQSDRSGEDAFLCKRNSAQVQPRQQR